MEYGREDLAGRGIAHVPAGQECTEKNCFHPHGVLLDCTCGNIITVKHFQHRLRRLCLMGYNTAIIYVKDIFQLPDEEKTYELIRKMLTFWRNAFSSGRIYLLSLF